MVKQEWQKGEESILTSLQRLEMHNDWLKSIHEQIKQELQSKTNTDEVEVLGFPED